MPQVADINVDLTDPGQPSRPRWGHSVAAHYGRSTEYVRSSVDSPYDYRATLQSNRWKLERTDKGYIASDVLTGIFGFGSDANQAARDLVVALHEHRDVLERQEALSAPLQEQLGYLRDLL
jgi:hypothetical protein